MIQQCQKNTVVLSLLSAYNANCTCRYTPNCVNGFSDFNSRINSNIVAVITVAIIFVFVYVLIYLICNVDF